MPILTELVINNLLKGISLITNNYQLLPITTKLVINTSKHIDFMTIPERPPKIEDNEIDDLFKYLTNESFNQLIKEANIKYYYWSDFKYKFNPGQISSELLWKIVRVKRALSAEHITISGVYKFKYNQTINTQKKLHEFDLNLGGRLGGEEIIPNSDKNRYLISSIMEEAIASSQLEGAATTRKEAKKMLREERKPKNESEQMILNNYNTIRKLKDLIGEKLTIDIILEIHSSITKNTLNSPGQEGQFRKSNDIVVVNSNGDIVHIPPDFEQLETLMKDYCGFANELNNEIFIHPIIRATILHFLMGYIHPFTNGNGRTARAIFYWYLLKEGYWLIEYMSISRMIKRSPGQYAKAYLYSEFDDNDLTYFINYHMKTMELAFDSLKSYINRKIIEKQEIYNFKIIKNINDRQILILKSLSDEPKLTFTIKEVQNRFNTAYDTARTDIIGLEKHGLIKKNISGKKKLVYYRAENFDGILSKLIAEGQKTIIQQQAFY